MSASLLKYSLTFSHEILKTVNTFVYVIMYAQVWCINAKKFIFIVAFIGKFLSGKPNDLYKSHRFQPEHYIKMLWVFTLPNWKSGICKFNMKLGLYFGSIRTLVCVCLCEVLLHERKRMTKTKECNLIRNKLCAVNPVWCVVEISFRLQYHTHSHTHTTNPKFCFFRLFSLCWRQSTLVNSFILQVYHHK